MRIAHLVFMVVTTSFLLSMSCNKNENKKSKSATSLVGTWELRETSGAMSPTVSKFPAGNGNLLIFTENTYELRKNGQVVKNGSYQIVADSTVEKSVCLVFPKGEYAYRIAYDDNNNEPKQFFHVSGNKLGLVAGCYAYDAGHKEVYEKINDTDH